MYYDTDGSGTAADTTPPVVTAAPVPQSSRASRRPRLVSRGRRLEPQRLRHGHPGRQPPGHSVNWMANVVAPWARSTQGTSTGATSLVCYRVTPTDCNDNAAPLSPGPRSAPGCTARVRPALHRHMAELRLSSAQGGHYRASSQTSGWRLQVHRPLTSAGWRSRARVAAVAYVAVNGVRVATINLYAKGAAAARGGLAPAFTRRRRRNGDDQGGRHKGHPSVDVDSLYVIGSRSGRSAHPRTRWRPRTSLRSAVSRRPRRSGSADLESGSRRGRLR